MDTNDLQVIIPYKDLMELLSALERIPKLEVELSRTNEQLTALRGLYSDLLLYVHQL